MTMNRRGFLSLLASIPLLRHLVPSEPTPKAAPLPAKPSGPDIGQREFALSAPTLRERHVRTVDGEALSVQEARGRAVLVFCEGCWCRTDQHPDLLVRINGCDVTKDSPYPTWEGEVLAFQVWRASNPAEEFGA